LAKHRCRTVLVGGLTLRGFVPWRNTPNPCKLWMVLKADARRKTGGHSGSRSPLGKSSLSLPVVLKDPVLGTSMRLSLSHQVASGLNWRRERGNKGVILVGWEGGIPAPDKS